MYSLVYSDTYENACNKAFEAYPDCDIKNCTLL